MKSFIASLALPLLAAAAPASQVTPDANPPFTVTAVRSASPIQYLQLNAAGQKFWLGGSTSSYCPTEVVPKCPPGNQTVLAPGGNALVRNTTCITSLRQTSHKSMICKSNIYTNSASTGRRSPRRPRSLCRLHRRPELHPSPLRQRPPWLRRRRSRLRDWQLLVALYLQRLGRKRIHGLSDRRQALAGLCRRDQCDRALR
jgi:hypothetical protein